MSLRKPLQVAVVVVLLLSIAAVSGLTGGKTQAQDDVPRFEPAACMFTLPEGQVEGRTVSCGYLSVPEDRSNANGPTIRLAVAIFKSTSASPAAPIIRLDGGPGGHSIASIGEQLFFLQSSEPLLARGDLILLDQRGVGFSQPSLACTELNDLELELLNQDVSLDEEKALYDDAVQRCRDRLVGQGVDLNAYTSAHNAADIHDLWTVLGYDEVNLYGVSYGTRLALTIMRDYPAGIRSVILDSAFPPQVDLYVDVDRDGQRALDLLFSECARDTACAARFPNLEKQFFETVERLNANPARVTLTSEETGEQYEWLVKGYDFYDLIFTSLYVTQLIGYLPAIISLTYQENYQLLEILGSVFILDFSIDYGMYYSVQCAEEVPFQTPEEVEAAVAALDVRYRQFAEAQPYDIFHTCAIWDVTPADLIEEMPISSDIPTLVVAGQFDPITPPAYGQATAATLSRSYFFEYPGRGHGVFDEGDCPLSITLAFLEDPATAPDGSCIEEMRVEFLIP